MSEHHYSHPPTSADADAEAAPRRIGPQLGLTCLAIGLGNFISVLVTLAVYTALDRPSPGMAVPALIGFLVAACFGAIAFTAYRRSNTIAWWHLLGLGFGVGLLLNSLGRLSERGNPMLVIAETVNFISLLLIVGGGIVAAVQAARKPAALPDGPLTAQLVGYTADGQPVYGSHLQGRSTNTFAVLALVFGIIGGLLGVVFGHIALSQIKRTGEGGHGLAVAGLALGYIYVVFWFLLIVVASI
ncbi:MULTISPECIES: DUF4190 domain-containing protein [unclassified Rhodococcus (in: high G+C Gram-positive bacteria)]|uniref:DUF4190 domain-containing protein n=1 Tax=unclassified Rhodococcus (in: high G+C Gram-positive bacteria) TaxID=192944 RepID=UPI0020CC8C09|nr:MULTISPECIES: DUF4190 domain-containing protein [unclassified Rhodococcus (in: high G+C Gram-positive bacteria)]